MFDQRSKKVAVIDPALGAELADMLLSATENACRSDV